MLCVLQNGLVVLVELFAGFEIKILARLFAPGDLALAVIVGLDVPFQLGKERIRVLDLAAAMIAVPPLSI